MSMTHLRIEQNTQIKETNVPASTITKLVLLSKSGTNMELVGWIGILGGIKKSEKDYMDQHYGNNGELLEWLTIDAPKIYLDFEDPAVETIMMSVASSDGIGVTVEDAAALLNNLFPSFENNTNITSFDELKEFTNVIQLTSNFRGCTNLTSVDLSNIQVIGHQSFTNSGITGVVNLPALVRFNYSYPMCPFNGCNNITEINIGPNLLDSTGISTDSTLSGCPNLTKVTGLSNITNIGKGTFSGDINLEYIDLDFSKLSVLNNALFKDCKKLFTNLDLSQTNFTEIGGECFYRCTSLLSITLPNTLTTIGNQAFFNCTGLTSINIPSGVTSIGNSAFNSCTSLTSVTIPDSVTSIGVSTFQNCSGLTSCTIGSGVTSIDGFVFYNCRSLTSIEIPDSVTSIGNQAFESCRSLNISIDLSNVTTLGHYAFSSSGITSITFNQNIDYLGNNIFLNCTSLTTANNIYKLSNSMFDGCSNLTTVTGLSNITSIPVNVFRSCGSLTSVDIQNVTKIENNAFYDCSNLEFNSPLNLSSVTSIGVLIFYNCSKLVIDKFPRAQTYSIQAFYNIGNTTITIPKEVKQMNSLCFGFCANLTTVLFESDSLITSMTLAFKHCTNLTGTVDIPEGFTTSEGSVFYECYKLKHVIYPSTTTSIGNAEFMYAYELVSVTVKATTPPTIVLGTFSHTPDNLIIYVPSESVSAYLSALYWNLRSSKIQAIPAS